MTRQLSSLNVVLDLQLQFYKIKLIKKKLFKIFKAYIIKICFETIAYFFFLSHKHLDCLLFKRGFVLLNARYNLHLITPNVCWVIVVTTCSKFSVDERGKSQVLHVFQTWSCEEKWVVV